MTLDAELEERLTRIEGETHEIITAVHDQNEQMRLIIARFDEIVALLTPKDGAGEPTLSDLLAHLIAQAREQILLSRRSVELLVDIQANLPEKTVLALEKYFSSVSRN